MQNREKQDARGEAPKAGESKPESKPKVTLETVFEVGQYEGMVKAIRKED